jgi:phytoene dehydrogenase-like protein
MEEGRMSERRFDATVIGAGHNGLVAAAYLAKAGLKTVVLEQRDVPGGVLSGGKIGAARIPSAAHTVGRLSPRVVSDLGLGNHGFFPISPDVRVWAPHPDGTALTLYEDAWRTSTAMQPISKADAAAYMGFDKLVRSLSGFLALIYDAPPPAIDKLGLEQVFTAARLTRAFRGLPPRDAQSLMRVLPMAVADFVGEHFSHDFVRGVLAARGVRYTAMGPWSAGTTNVLLGDSAGNDGGAAGESVFARGGPGALADALVAAAKSFGVDIRLQTAVAEIRTDTDARVTGVTTDTGEEIEARAVVSGTDPKRTLCRLIDPVVVGPQLRWRASNIRMPGAVAKVNLVLDALPGWSPGDDAAANLRGRIVMSPGIDYLERAHDDAKYGRVADSPYMEATIPTLVDPSLAPEGVHVMSVLVNYAPYHRGDGDWDADRENFGDLVLKSLDDYAPGIGDRVIDREIITPLDLERSFGLTEGHPTHGEPGLDQLFAWRPLWGLARYALGIEGLYLCGSGAHPGGGVTGMPGRNAAAVVIKELKRRH